MNRVALLGTLLFGWPFLACGVGNARPEVAASPAQPEDALVGTALANDPLAADLNFLREEEKLARDVYLTLFDRWQLRPHQNISSSEQTHIDRVKRVLLTFNLPDPVIDDRVGTFVDVRLDALYRELIDRGLSSELGSLEAGATIEDLDIRDLRAMKSRTQDPLVLSMYSALECGSGNHLRAFTSQLAMRGVTYQPQYLPLADYQAILDAPHQRCGR